MKLNLNNKNVLVTAASSGIGKAVAEMFLAENCNVVICSSNETKLLSAANELKEKTGNEPLHIKCNINDVNEIERTVEFAKSELGRVDILVNNCGGPKPGFFEDFDDADWNDAVNQVLLSAVRFTKSVLSGMKEQNWGRIINVTSVSVKQPIDNLLLSNSLRNAVTAFAKTLSNQVGKFNITINNVAPGLTLTGRLEELAELKAKDANISKAEMLKQMAKEIPLKRLAAPEEIASAVVYLASEIAGYITGQTIVVDGGFVKSTL